MKILVFGSTGMAGHAVVKYLKQCGYEIHTAARSNADYFLDIEKTELLKNFIEEIKHDYDFIINCVGLLVKESIERPDLAILVNSWFPHYIENAIKNSKTKLIHLSTDCVFDGVKGNYIESDIHSETNFYGKSKSLGEINNNKDITFRMSIIGPEIKNNGTGLLHWTLTNSKLDIPGWENAQWNGITTLQLAKCIESYIQNPKISGIYHLVNNNQKINKYELLKKINEIYNLNKNVIKTNGPKNINKVLVNTRTDFSFEIVDYDQQLIELREF